MSSLLELLAANNSDKFAKHFAGQHAIDQNDAQRAIEALLPAFSNGLKRNAHSPQGLGSLMQALANGNHARYSDDVELVSSSEGITEGNKILGHLFKSKDVSRNIAASASKNTGISASILKQMLPALAPLILGALTKNMQSNNTPQYASGSGANPLGRILEELMKNGMGGSGRSGGSGNNPLGNNPLGDILEQVLKNKGTLRGGGNRGANPSDGSRAERLGNIFEDMLRGKTKDVEISGSDNLQDDVIEQYSDPYMQDDLSDIPSTRGGGLEDLFGDMLRPSQNERSQYDDEVDSIFDEFLGPQR